MWTCGHIRYVDMEITVHIYNIYNIIIERSLYSQIPRKRKHDMPDRVIWRAPGSFRREGKAWIEHLVCFL